MCRLGLYTEMMSKSKHTNKNADQIKARQSARKQAREVHGLLWFIFAQQIPHSERETLLPSLILSCWFQSIVPIHPRRLNSCPLIQNTSSPSMLCHVKFGKWLCCLPPRFGKNVKQNQVFRDLPPGRVNQTGVHQRFHEARGWKCVQFEKWFLSSGKAQKRDSTAE